MSAGNDEPSATPVSGTAAGLTDSSTEADVDRLLTSVSCNNFELPTVSFILCHSYSGAECTDSYWLYIQCESKKPP